MLGLQQHLLGGHCPARVPAHAIGQNSQQAVLAKRMRNDGNSILLFGTIPDVHRRTGINGKRHESGSS